MATAGVKYAGWIITTIAGNGSEGYSGDGGPAAQAKLNGPHDVVCDAAGNLQADPAKFPSGLPALAAAIRKRGLRLGLYTDLGAGSCGPGPGSGGHWPQDARYFASLGADYIKRVAL